MQYKSRKFFSELKTFFKNNDNSEAVLSVSRVMDDVRINFQRISQYGGY